MELVIGFVVGIVVTLLLGGVAAYLLLHDDSPLAVPETPPDGNKAASVTVIVLEPFLNAQLAQLMAAEGAPSSGQAVGPVKFKVNGARLDLKRERQARLTVQLTATAWNLNVNFRPITEFTLMPQNGRARIVVNQIELGGVKIPRQWVDSVIKDYVADAEAKLNQTLAQLEKDTSVELYELETSEDMLVLKFSSR